MTGVVADVSSGVAVEVERVSSAFDEFFAATWPDLVAFCTRGTGSVELGEELTQEALTRVYVRFPLLREPRPYAFKVAGNPVRRSWRRQPVLLDRSPQALPDHDVSTLDAVRRLPDALREVVLLHYWRTCPSPTSRGWCGALRAPSSGACTRRGPRSPSPSGRTSMTDLPSRALRRPPAPGVLDRVVREGRRRRRRLAASAAGATLLLAGVLVAVSGQPSDDDRVVTAASPSAAAAAPSPPPAAPCPETLGTAPGDRSVPAPPPEELASALVPADAPLAATVCRYGDASLQGFGQSAAPPDTVALEGSRRLEGGLSDVPDDLALPAGDEVGPCTLVGGPIVPYLLQLQYETGTVWVRTSSDLNSCELVTNGRFTSAVYVGGQVEASYAEGSWVPAPRPWNAPDDGACPRVPTGRAGQEDSLVPPGWQSLVLCATSGGAQSSRVIADDRARRVAELLGSLPTEADGGYSASCDRKLSIEGDDGGQLFLRFDYPRGRDVVVIPFLGCDPSLGNGSLSAQASAGQQEELLRLLRPGVTGRQTAGQIPRPGKPSRSCSGPGSGDVGSAGAVNGRATTLPSSAAAHGASPGPGGAGSGLSGSGSGAAGASRGPGVARPSVAGGADGWPAVVEGPRTARASSRTRATTRAPSPPTASTRRRRRAATTGWGMVQRDARVTPRPAAAAGR
jgi:hypothetical protein